MPIFILPRGLMHYQIWYTVVNGTTDENVGRSSKPTVAD